MKLFASVSSLLQPYLLIGTYALLYCAIRDKPREACELDKTPHTSGPFLKVDELNLMGTVEKRKKPNRELSLWDEIRLDLS